MKNMQLKDARMYRNTLYMKIDAPIDQWVELLGMTWDDFEKEYDGSAFKLIKFMNVKAGGKKDDLSSANGS